jgi:hypothetical protein
MMAMLRIDISPVIYPTPGGDASRSTQALRAPRNVRPAV